MFSKMLGASALLYFATAEPNPPMWDTQTVKIISPGQGDAQAILDAIHNEQGGMSPPNHGQFSDSRYAILLEPGTHNVNIDVGFYTTVHGLGRTPNDVSLASLICQDGAKEMTMGALDNFWRGAENLSVHPAGGKMIWASSQASPLRRIVVNGDLDLYQYIPPFQGAGFASGGYMSDSQVTGTVTSGSQQQYIIRNSNMGKFITGVWNMVFVGSPGAPADHCSNKDGGPYTTVDETPVIVEKPYIISSGAGFSLMVPRMEKNKVGHTPGFNNADERTFNNVFVANQKDSAATINSKLSEGLDVVLQPGQYHLTESIKVNKDNQVVLGLGLATLIATTGQPCIEVGDVDGVRISGLLLQAGETNSPTLLTWGNKGYAGKSENPGAMHDVFARVGGPDQNEVKASIMVQINSGYVIIDDTWLWRADHNRSGLVKNKSNPVDTGLQINGDSVTGYGLACEHTLGHMLEWNGNNGKSYFYQSEYPYDVDQSYADAGFAGYKVADTVKTHSAWGTGVYSYFRDHTVVINSGIKAPKTGSVTFHNALSVFLNGKGQINHVINDEGNAVRMGDQLAYQCDWAMSEESGYGMFLN